MKHGNLSKLLLTLTLLSSMVIPQAANAGLANLDSPKDPCLVLGVDHDDYQSGTMSSAYFQTCYEKADEELNKVYKRIVKYIRNEAKAEYAEYLTDTDIKAWYEGLRNAQRGWIKYKEAECGIAEYHWIGGMGVGDAEPGCLMGMTLERTAKLKADYKEVFPSDGVTR